MNLFTRQRRQSPHRTTAFTIMEMMVVLAIIAVLAVILVPSIGRALQIARANSTRANIRILGSGLNMYRNDFNNYPPSANPGYIAGSDWTGASLLVVWMQGDDENLLLDEGGNSKDRKSGIGYRVVRGGQVHGPYGTADLPIIQNNQGRMMFADAWDQPILYYRYDAQNRQYYKEHNQDVIQDPNDKDINGPAYVDEVGNYRQDFLLISPGIPRTEPNMPDMYDGDEYWDNGPKTDFNDITNFLGE